MAEVQAPDRNYMAEAVASMNGASLSINQMEVVDAMLTEKKAEIETDMYENWNEVLQGDMDQLDALVASGKTDTATQNKITQIQSQYGMDSSSAQSEETQQDADVNAGEGQAQNDASNLQQIVKNFPSLMTILSTLTGILGKGVIR